MWNSTFRAVLLINNYCFQADEQTKQLSDDDLAGNSNLFANIQRNDNIKTTFLRCLQTPLRRNVSFGLITDVVPFIEVFLVKHCMPK